MRYRHFITAICAVLLLVGCSKLVFKKDAEAIRSEWPQFGKNAQHTRESDVAFQFPLKLKWMHKASAGVNQSLISVNDAVIFGTKDGRIEGVNLDSGDKFGQIKIRGNFSATAMYHLENLFYILQISQPTVTRYNIKSGDTVWKKNASPLVTEPLIADDVVYIAELNGNVKGYAFADGAEVWKTKLKSQIHSTPAYSNGYLLIGDDAGVLHAFDQQAEKIWEFKTQTAIYATPVISDNTVYVCSTDGTFSAVDLKTGKQVFVFATKNKLYNGAAISDDKVIFGSTDRNVYCLNKDTGKLLWKFAAESVISTAPVISQNAVFIGCMDKKLYALSLDSGELLWSFEADGRIQSDPIIVNNLLLFASEDNRVYCFEQG